MNFMTKVYKKPAEEERFFVHVQDRGKLSLRGLADPPPSPPSLPKQKKNENSFFFIFFILPGGSKQFFFILTISGKISF